MPTKKGNNKNGGSKAKQQDQTLQDLLVIKLQALLDVEQQLVKALPTMAKKSTEPDLKAGFEKHAKETEEHVTRLEKIFTIMGVPAKKLQGEAIRGLVADAQWCIKNIRGAEALDASLVAAAQYVEHYEIAGYSSAIAWARLLDRNDAADILESTLHEEENTSDALMELAESKIDEMAMPVEEEEDEEKNT